MRIILLDVENLGMAPDILQQADSEDALVVVCYTTKAPKVPLPMVPMIAEAMQTNRFHFHEIAPGGNAADFGLTYHAGKLVAAFEKPLEMIVCSNDKHLDTLVHCLRQDGIDARRCSDTDFLDDGEDCEALAFDYATKLSSQSSRPRTRKTLRKAASTFMKQQNRNGVTPVAIIRQLERLDLIAIADSGTITYRLDHLSRVQTSTTSTTTYDDIDDALPF